MDLKSAINILKSHRDALREKGVVSMSIIGSVARGESTPQSDIDIVARIENETFSVLDRAQLVIDLEDWLGADVDFVREPTSKPYLQAEIDRDRILAF